LRKPETASGTEHLAAQVTNKRGYAERWQSSVRTVDNWIARGLPHIKLSPRMIRINIPEADAWLRQKFGCQRFKGDHAA